MDRKHFGLEREIEIGGDDVAVLSRSGLQPCVSLSSAPIFFLSRTFLVSFEKTRIDRLKFEGIRNWGEEEVFEVY